MSQPRPLFDIWYVEPLFVGMYPWRAQLSGYVASYLTREEAERYVAHVKAYREKYGTKSPAS